jgi:hypothetical protein
MTVQIDGTAPRLKREQIVNSTIGWVGSHWVAGIAYKGGTQIPSSGQTGQLFIEFPEGNLLRYDSSIPFLTNKWVNIGPATMCKDGGKFVDYGTSFPSSPKENDLFNKLNDDKVYQRVGSSWVSLGSNENPFPTGTETLKLNDPIRGVGVNLFLIISDFSSEPLLAVDRGVVIKKDITAGGFVGSNQGTLYLGHGIHNENSKPRITLIDSENGYDTLHLMRADDLDGSPAHLDVDNLISHGTVKTSHLQADAASSTNTVAIHSNLMPYNLDQPQNNQTQSFNLGSSAYPFENLYTKKIDATGVIHGGGSYGKAFLVGDDIYLVDVNSANRLCLQGAQNNNEAGVQFGNGGPSLYRQNNYLICETLNSSSGGFSTNGSLSFGNYNTGATQGPLYRNINTGQIGIYSSSERFKTNVNAADDCSWIYELQPVTFDWKDKERSKAEGTQLGLIAEEVHKKCPQLTWRDGEGTLEGVHYEWLGVPLLVEIKKLRREVDELKAKLASSKKETVA